MHTNKNMHIFFIYVFYLFIYFSIEEMLPVRLTDIWCEGLYYNFLD